MSKQIKLVVTMDRPEGASILDIRRYVKEAVEAWGGSLEPMHDGADGSGIGCQNEDCQGDPMHGLHKATVKVYQP